MSKSKMTRSEKRERRLEHSAKKQLTNEIKNFKERNKNKR